MEVKWACPQGKLYTMKSIEECYGFQYRPPPCGTQGHMVIAASPKGGEQEVVVCTITSKLPKNGVEFLHINVFKDPPLYYTSEICLQQKVRHYCPSVLRKSSFVRLEPFKIRREMLLPVTSTTGAHLILTAESIDLMQTHAKRIWESYRSSATPRAINPPPFRTLSALFCTLSAPPPRTLSAQTCEQELHQDQKQKWHLPTSTPAPYYRNILRVERKMRDLIDPSIKALTFRVDSEQWQTLRTEGEEIRRKYGIPPPS
ncbi:hypothetical protein Vi05172_g828 [Venturia inaequalis]|nr:hypothetical protein Vi05172_g828 [Venturia inaequalis]